MSDTEQGSRPTPLTVGFVILLAAAAVAASAWRLDAVLAGASAVVSGVTVGVALRVHRRLLPVSVLVAAGAVSVGTAGVALAGGLGALAAYDSFGTRSVAPAALIARVLTFSAFIAGAVVAGGGLGITGRRRDDSPSRFIWIAGGVAGVYALISAWLLRELIALNAAALGVDPTGALSLVLFAAGASGTHVGSLLALLAAAGGAVFTAIDRLSLAVHARAFVGEWAATLTESFGRTARVGAIVSALFVGPAALFDTAGSWPSTVAGVPVESILMTISTSATLRAVLLSVTVAAVVAVLGLMIAEIGWQRLLSPAAGLVGAATGPLAVVMLVERTDLVAYATDRAPPDAAQSIQLLVDELGAVELFVSIAAGGAVLTAVVVLLGSTLVAVDAVPQQSLPAILAGGGALATGVAVVAHDGIAAAGLFAVCAGLLAWWLGAFGHGVATAVAPNSSTTVEAVHAGASIAAVTAGAAVFVALVVGIDLAAGTPDTAGVGVILALVGLGLLALAIRRSTSAHPG